MATTGLLLQVKKEDPELHNSLYNCAECDFTSSYGLHIKFHIQSHKQSAKFRCFQCNTFSSDAVSILYRHLKNHHRSLGLKTEEERNQERKMSLRSVSAPVKVAATHQPEHVEGHAYRSHNCTECEFTSNSRSDMRQHKRMHEWNKTHKCPHCSYSSDTKGVVSKHSVKYHRKMIDSQLEIANEQPEEPLVGSVGCHHCHICDFSTNSSVILRDHEKTHRRNVKFNCAHCPLSFYSKDELWAHSKHHRQEPSTSTSKKRRSESPIIKLENGVELKVEKSEKTTPKNRGRKSYSCGSCDYRIDSFTHMRKHEMCHHRRNQKYKCHRCTYSSNNNKAVRIHMDRHHLDGSTYGKKLKSGPPSTLLKKTCVKSEPGLRSNTQSGSRQRARSPEKKLRNLFCLRECSVVLEDVFASSKKPTLSSSKAVPTEPRMTDGKRKSPEFEKLETEEAECRQQINQIEEAIHLDHLKMEKLKKKQKKHQAEAVAEEEKRVHLLEIRIVAMKEKVQKADQDLKAISSKDDVQKKIAEIVCRKTLVEYNLRTQQCEALQMSLTALESDTMDMELETEFGGEQIKKLEDEMNQMDDELSALKEEQENLETAHESHVGTVQVLEAMVLELDGLKRKAKAPEGDDNIREQMSQLAAMLEERRGTLQQLEERWQKIINLKQSIVINHQESQT